jgi:hypothetical protein
MSGQNLRSIQFFFFFLSFFFFFFWRSSAYLKPTAFQLPSVGYSTHSPAKGYCTDALASFFFPPCPPCPLKTKVPPLLRYGKYCGILYSGCPGEKPCDALDACCMVHDHCVDTHNSTHSPN